LTTLTKEQLRLKKWAIGGLLSHTFVFSGLLFWESQSLLLLPQPIERVVLLAVTMLPFAIIPLWFAVQLYEGVNQRGLRGWAIVWFVIGFYFLFGSVVNLPIYFFISLSFDRLLYFLLPQVGLISFFLIPSGIVLRLTGKSGEGSTMRSSDPF
jgi:hypothetical protein